MKLLSIIAGICLLSGSLLAQNTVKKIPTLDNNNVWTGTDQFSLGLLIGPVSASTLSGLTSADTTLIYCSDCLVQAACVGGGSGAWAQRVSGVWSCSGFGGGGGSGFSGANNRLVKGTSTTTIGNSGIKDDATTISLISPEAVDLNNATSLKIPVATGAAPTANGSVAYDSTANKYIGGVNGIASYFANMATSNTYTAGAQDFSGAGSTIPWITGSGAPSGGACTKNGQAYYRTDGTAGQQLYFCNGSGTWTLQLNSGASGASTALSNLASVAINLALIPAVGNLNTSAADLGSGSLPFRSLWMGPAATTNHRFISSATAARTFTLPDFSGTAAELERDQTFTGNDIFSNNVTIPGFIGAGVGSLNFTSLGGALPSTPGALSDGLFFGTSCLEASYSNDPWACLLRQGGVDASDITSGLINSTQVDSSSTLGGTGLGTVLVSRSDLVNCPTIGYNGSWVCNGLTNRTTAATSDTILTSDLGDTIRYVGAASAVAVTVPAPTGSFAAPFYFWVENRFITGEPIVTLTASGGATITNTQDTATNLILYPGETAYIYAGDTTHWYAIKFTLSGGALVLGGTAPLLTHQNRLIQNSSQTSLILPATPPNAKFHTTIINLNSSDLVVSTASNVNINGVNGTSTPVTLKKYDSLEVWVTADGAAYNATNLPYKGGTGLTITNASNGRTIAQNTANTYRVCSMVVGADNGSALANADLGPQGRQCFIPYAATIVEMNVAADAGTPNVIVGRNRAGSIVNIVSGALATASAGAIACSNTGGTTGVNGATTCSATLQNTGINAGDYLELVSGTAGGVAKRMSVFVLYSVN